MAVSAGRRLAGAAAAFAAVAVVASATRTDQLADADRTLFEGVRAHRSQAKTTVARFVSAFGEPSVAYPAVVAAAVAGRSNWRRAGLACLVIFTGAEARKRLSRVIARKRPPVAAWLTKPEGYSLPSRHTTVAALAAGACAQTLGARGAPARTAPMLAAVCVGASRVYLGVHWPADVVAGWLFAEGWLRLTDTQPQGDQ